MHSSFARGDLAITVELKIKSVLVVGSGFEPLKAKPADLQSAPIGHSGNPPFST
jgi:hypothetical protein